LTESNYAQLARLLGIKAVQVSERDTQKVSMVVGPNQFISTWNIPSFCEELAAPAEFSWGTHEPNPPQHCKFYGEREREKSFISLDQRGHQTWAKSWMPGENDFRGMVVRHEECFSMANYVSIRSDDTGELVYRPTVYFVYDQQLSAESIKKFVGNNYELLPQATVVEREVKCGADKLGVFLLGHDFGGWWIGSHLDIDTARRLCADMEQLVGSIGPTALQVGATLAAAVYWGILHPWSGAHFPETIPTDVIIQAVKPWLGTWVSQRHQWSPLLSKSLDQIGEDSSTMDSPTGAETGDTETETETDSESDSEASIPVDCSPAAANEESPPAVRARSSSLSAAVCNDDRLSSRSPSPEHRQGDNMWQFSNFLAPPPQYATV